MSSDKLVCRHCGYSAPDATWLRKHMRKDHDEERYLFCRLCNFSTNRKSRLLKHVERKHGQESEATATGLQCQNCSFKTRTEGGLKKHVKARHAGTTDFSCEECGFSTRNELRLIQHKKTVHGGKAEDLNSLQKNVRSLQDEANRKDFRCEQCAYSSRDEASLLQHRKAVHDFLVCDRCEFSAKDIQTLQKHFKSVHGKERNFKCEECSFAAASEDSLRKHTFRVHNGGSEFKCKECAFATGCEDRLGRHVKRVHVRLKRFRCAECDYTASCEILLLQHTKDLHEKKKKNKKKEQGSSARNTSRRPAIQDLRDITAPSNAEEPNADSDDSLANLNFQLEKRRRIKAEKYCQDVIQPDSNGDSDDVEIVNEVTRSSKIKEVDLTLESDETTANEVIAAQLFGGRVGLEKRVSRLEGKLRRKIHKLQSLIDYLARPKFIEAKMQNLQGVCDELKEAFDLLIELLPAGERPAATARLKEACDSVSRVMEVARGSLAEATDDAERNNNMNDQADMSRSETSNAEIQEEENEEEEATTKEIDLAADLEERRTNLGDQISILKQQILDLISQRGSQTSMGLKLARAEAWMKEYKEAHEQQLPLLTPTVRFQATVKFVSLLGVWDDMKAAVVDHERASQAPSRSDDDSSVASPMVESKIEVEDFQISEVREDDQADDSSAETCSSESAAPNSELAASSVADPSWEMKQEEPEYELAIVGTTVSMATWKQGRSTDATNAELTGETSSDDSSFAELKAELLDHYKCVWCTEDLFGRQELASHLQEMHSLSLNEYFETTKVIFPEDE